MIFAIANVNAKATIGTMTQNETMTSKDLTYKTWYATPTPTTDPTVTSLVESGMPSTFAIKSDSAADPIIMQTISSEITRSGMMPELIVFTTFPPPMTAPERTPAAQIRRA